MMYRFKSFRWLFVGFFGILLYTNFSFAQNYGPSDDDLKSKSFTFNMPIQSLYLYADIAPNTYTVNFDGNGNTAGHMSGMFMIYDREYNLLANKFVKYGYTFAGWSTSKTGVVEYFDQAKVINLVVDNGGSITLYAQWIENGGGQSGGGGKGGGGGGGGGVDYECKNLPANAKANNNLRPKADTNYSYSANTSIACTFQCNSGYIRNLVTKSCEKNKSDLSVEHGSASSGTDTTKSLVIQTGQQNSNLGKDSDKGDSYEYDSELINAYKWAYSLGITNAPTIGEARLYDNITREQLAKMMVVYVSKVLGKKPVINKTAKYRDVTVKLRGQEMYDYIQLAYQYQIMGINANGTQIRYFNPEGRVTRAEFATVLSRVLYGSKYNQKGSKYYTKHMKALNNAGILSDTNPNIIELRGWIILMLYRSLDKIRAR